MSEPVLSDVWLAKATQEVERLRRIEVAARALFMCGYDEPNHSVIFDPHGAEDEIAALAEALKAQSPDWAT